MESSIINVTSSPSKNITSSDFPICELFPESLQSFYFRVVSLFCIMLTSLIGNVLVCYGATRQRSRPFSYYLVTNLAVAELTFTSIHPFQFVYNTKPYSWIFGDFMCHIIDPLTLCTTLVITFTLAAIAVYRCIMMLQPYRCRPSTRVAHTVIALSWVWGIVLSLPDSVTRTTRAPSVDCDVFVCENDVVDFSDYRMTVFILNFVVPFIMMVLAYTVVICRVKKHIFQTKQESLEMQLQTSESTGTLTTSMTYKDTKNPPQAREIAIDTQYEENSNDGSQPRTPSSNKMIQLETDVLNMIYLIILLFFLCYLPSNVLFILTEGLGLDSVKRWHYYWLMIWYLDLLHMVPSALHPICYGANTMLIGLFCKWSWRRGWFRK